ncbi:MAG: PIN domain-containing protein [Kiloniellales bacterium]|nr:PIN domain-containing protein [Kiloniellales bacterium]
MVLVDTSVWVDVFRDSTGLERSALQAALGEDDVVLTRFNQLELLQGAREEREWTLLVSYLDHQEYLEARADTWRNAARIYFELRRRGRTVRSPIDCCIAQLALDHGALLIHRDRDFETIADVRALRQQWL